MTRESIDFARLHLHDDSVRLLLSATRYQGIDMPAAVQQIEGLRTAVAKWPSLFQCETYEYPPRLNREQSSSEATARHKAFVVGHVDRVADLTGGMGVDTWAFSEGAKHVDYVEHDAELCSLMERNCQALKLRNVDVHCADSVAWLNEQGMFDLLYIDPARRSASGRKVVAFDDCTPDLLTCLPLLYSHTKRLLVKSSPMIDISVAQEQLQRVREVHVVAVKGECKEVLFLCGEGSDEPLIHCTNLSTDHKEVFVFRRSEEKSAVIDFASSVGAYLYDPNAAIMKGGPYKLLAKQFPGIEKIAPSTHLYTSHHLCEGFPGRVFEVIQQITLDYRTVRKLLPEGRAHVVVCNFPQEAVELQRQLKLQEGGDKYMVATTMADGRRVGLLCSMIRK